MANRNIFKKHCNLFIKNKKQNVLIERYDDNYYISDGFTLLRVPEFIYNCSVRPLSPMFIPLENGQGAIRRPGETLPDIKPGHRTTTLHDCFTKYEAINPVTVTPFVYNPVNDPKMFIRLVTLHDNRPMCYNDYYMEAIHEYCGVLTATADRFPALKWEDPTNRTACMVLPVNAKPCFAALNDLVEVLKK